jgi:predicted solute-binding protein
VADGASAITIVDGLAALEPVEAGFSEDLVRAWYILTEQSVVTHLLAVPAEASDEEVDAVRSRLTDAAAAGYAARREVRRALQANSSVETDRLVEFFAGIRYDLDADDRAAAYSLIARGSGGTRYPLLREIPWRPAGEAPPST